VDAGERVVDAGGVPVAVRTVGGGDGPPVVLVHGIYVNGHLWDEVLGRVAPTRTCHVLTLPLGGHEVGVGPAHRFSLDGMAATVLDVLVALDLRDVTLVANDTGCGLVLLALGSDHPGTARIGRVVLTNGDAFEWFPPRRRQPLVDLARRSPAAASAFLRVALGTPAGRRTFLATLMRRRPPAITRRMFSTVHVDEAVRLTAAGSVTPQQRAMAWLPDVTVPVTVLWGRRCLLFPAAVAERLADRLPDARLVWIRDAGTYVPLDAPAEVAAAIL
jgi:pimeloyl-ACP methyl ester carboxylesterase